VRWGHLLFNKKKLELKLRRLTKWLNEQHSTHLSAWVHWVDGRVLSSEEIEENENVDSIQVIAGHLAVGVGLKQFIFKLTFHNSIIGYFFIVQFLSFYSI
jgi:hypothetical protein